MATSGDVFRSYQPSGGGRDVHLFISAASTFPRTAQQYDQYRSPVGKMGAFSQASTSVPPRFASDGGGRDSYMGDRAAPCTGKVFNPYVAPTGQLPPKPAKGFHYATGTRAGYAPNGGGRDLQLFVDAGSPVPQTGYQFSAVAPSAKRFQQPTVAGRTDPPTKTRPNGTGRDLFQIAMGGPRTIPRTSVSFSEVPPSPKGALPAMRTSPPPKYTPSGSGRDGFHRITYDGLEHNPADAFGFGPPRWDPAALRRPKASSAGQQRSVAALSRPRSTGGAERAPVGLLVPGANLRKYP